MRTWGYRRTVFLQALISIYISLNAISFRPAMGRRRVHDSGLHHLHIMYPTKYENLIHELKALAVKTGRPMWEIVIEAIKHYLEDLPVIMPTQPPISQEADDIFDRVKVEAIKADISIGYNWFLEVCDEFNRLVRSYTPRPDQPNSTSFVNIFHKLHDIRRTLLKSLSSLPRKCADERIREIAESVVELTPLTEDARRIYLDWLNGRLKLY